MKRKSRRAGAGQKAKREVKLAMRAALDARELAKAGKPFSARHILPRALSLERAQSPELVALERTLWSVDDAVRGVLVKKIHASATTRDAGTQRKHLGDLNGVLETRMRDLGGYLRELGERPRPPRRKDRPMSRREEEVMLRAALRALRAGRKEEAAKLFRSVYQSTAIRRKKVVRAVSHPASPGKVLEAVRDAGLADEGRWKVWGHPRAVDASEGGVTRAALTRMHDEGVNALLHDPVGASSVSGARKSARAGSPRAHHGGGAFVGDSMRVDAPPSSLGKLTRSAPTAERPPVPSGERVRRTPHMDLSDPAPLRPGATLEVAVYADQSPPREGEDVLPVEVEIPPHLEFLEIGVTLVPSGHFRLEGPARRPLRIERARAHTDRVRFSIQVAAEDELRAGGLADPATGVLTAVFDDRGRPAGRVVRRVEIALTAQDAPAPPDPPPSGSIVMHADARALAVEAALSAGQVLSTDPAADLPDILVDVLPHENNSGREYRVRVVTPNARVAGDEAYEPWNLPQATSVLVPEYMKEFTRADAMTRVAALRGAGKQFWRAAPESFKRAYWRLVDAGTPPRSISLVSVEPHVPWELMIPHRGSGASSRSSEPLGVSTLVGRWTRTDGVAAEQRITLAGSRVIAPVYTSRPLKHAQEEAALVTSHFPGSVITPADLRTITRELGAAEDLSLLHLVCHGSTAGAFQTLKLEGDYELSTTVASGLEELEALFGRRKTLVFLNACEVGRTTAGLVGVEGFADAFIQMGAVAVIAPLWAVRDSIAYEVARAVYEGIRADPSLPFAAIFQEIRRRAYDRETGEDTYAAYCFYGDPLARMA